MCDAYCGVGCGFEVEGKSGTDVKSARLSDVSVTALTSLQKSGCRIERFSGGKNSEHDPDESTPKSNAQLLQKNPTDSKVMQGSIH